MNPFHANQIRHLWKFDTPEQGMELSAPRLVKEGNWSSETLRLMQVLLEELPLLWDKTVLDVGCGVGRLIEHFAYRAISTTGVDISASMVRCATRRLEGYPGCGVILTKPEFSTSDRPFGFDALSDAFDVVFSIDCLEHQPNEECERELVRDIVSACKPGGTVCIQTVEAHDWLEKMLIDFGIHEPRMTTGKYLDGLLWASGAKL